MDKSEQISLIMEPVRTLVLTGNSMKHNKNEFVLTHVNRYIAEERKEAFKLFKRKNNQQNQKKDQNAHCNDAHQNSEDSVQDVLASKKLDLEYAEFAVHDWEEYAVDLIKLIQEGKGREVLNALLTSLELPSVCMESVVFCLVLLIKKSSDLKIVSDSYSYVRQICKTTNLFMLFIQYCKIFTIANSKCSGWGRGMKKAIRNWYLKWEPRELALEVTRHPSAYTWSHKDVLKMAHINLKDLPLGHALVLHYIFAGFESTKKKYEAEKNATELLHLLEVLNEGANEIINSHVIIERGKNIINTFGSVSLNDFPFQALNDVKVMSFLLENGSSNLIIEALTSTCLFKLVNSSSDIRSLLIKQLNKDNFSNDVDLLKVALAYNSCRRISAELIKHDESKLNDSTKKRQWMKNAQPNPDRHKKIKSPTPRTIEINDVFKALSQVITNGAQDTNKNCAKRPVVFIDFEPAMEMFISVLPENPVSKELRATQAVAFILLALGTSNLSRLIPLCRDAIDKFNIPNVDCTFSSILSSLNKYVRLTSRLIVSSSLELVIEMKSSTALLIYCKLTEEIVKEVYEKFKEIKARSTGKDLRVIVCGLDAPNVSVNPKEYAHSDILLLYGFNRYTIPVIQAFTNGLL